MSLDSKAIKRRIATGIYGDDWITEAEIRDAFSALEALAAEVERLRAHRESCTANLLKGYETGKAEERAAVVAWLRYCDTHCREHDGRENAVSATYRIAASIIERGVHRREEKP